LDRACTTHDTRVHDARMSVIGTDLARAVGMEMNKRALVVIASAVASLWLSGCGGTDAGSDESQMKEQSSSDATLVRAEAKDSIGGEGPAVFADSDCTAVPDDSGDNDCTAAFEQRVGLPALHPIRVPTVGMSFSCHILRVTMATRKDRLETSDGVGFYYEGYETTGDKTLIERDRLKRVGDAVLKDGTDAELQQFAGLANCWEGTGSRTEHARYEFKPFLQVTDPDSGEISRRWDGNSNYVLTPGTTEIDRSAEVLAKE